MLLVILSLVAAGLLVLVNAVLVAAELSIVRVRRTRLEELAGLGHRAAAEAIELVDRMDEYLTTTQIGVTAVGLGVGWLGESAFADLVRIWIAPAREPVVHAIAGAAAFVLITLVHVVIGELVPKNLAIVRADRYLMALVTPLRVIHRIMRPLTAVVTLAARALTRAFGARESAPPPISESELKLVLMDSHEDGILTRGEAAIILRAFEFADRPTTESMTPAEKVDFISLSRSFEENLATARSHGHTHLPLCRTNLDSAFAVVSVLEVFFRFEASNATFERSAHPLVEIPPDLSQEGVLRRLKSTGAALAVVRDPSSRRVLGVMTLQNVLDSLVAGVDIPAI